MVVDKVIVKLDYEYEEQENVEDNDRGGQDVCKAYVGWAAMASARGS